MTSILKTALEDIKKLDESLDPEDWASDESMLSITGRVIAALKEAIKNQGAPVAFIRRHPNGNKELIWSMDWRFDQQDHTPLYTSAPTIPEALFDGFAVYQMLDDRAKHRTSPENVSDTLDAVVKLLRSSAYIGNGSQSAKPA